MTGLSPIAALGLTACRPRSRAGQALALHADWLEKLPWGKKVVGLRIALARAKPAWVEALLRQARAARAPRRLLPGPGGSA